MRHNAVPVSIALAVCLALSGCDDAPTQATQVQLSWLSGSAAANVNEHGRFRLQVAPADQIDEQTAVALAEKYVARFGRFFAVAWAEDRNGEVDYETLTSCGRAYYATSTYDDLPPTADNIQFRATFGPRWFVTLCSSGVPQLSVAVSALLTDPAMLRGIVGGSFVARGIPSSTSEIIMAPEEAARRVHEATGQRVTTVPELVVPPLPSVPQLAKWRITIDEPAVVRGEHSGARRSTRTVYVGAGRSFDWAGLQDAHPSGATPPTLTVHTKAGEQTFRLKVRSNRAGALEPVAVEKP